MSFGQLAGLLRSLFLRYCTFKMADILYGAGSLYDELIASLKKENNYVADNGDIKKWVVAEKARAYSPELIELLLDNEQLKNAFLSLLRVRWCSCSTSSCNSLSRRTTSTTATLASHKKSDCRWAANSFPNETK